MTVEDIPDPSTHCGDLPIAESRGGKVYRNGPHELDIDFDALDAKCGVEGTIEGKQDTVCDSDTVIVPEATPQGVGSFRSRPRRVNALFYDGDNLQDVINWLRFQEPEAIEVNGEWEIDHETNEPVDCRFLDLYTVDGLLELDILTWIVLTELGVELHCPKQFEVLYAELAPAKAA